MNHYRQGDVLVVRVGEIPSAVKPIPKEAGRIVLAHGEVTGHSHAIQSKTARFVINEATQQRYLDVKAPLECLRHEEHGEIQLPSGHYEVIIQREYTPEEIRNVVD